MPLYNILLKLQSALIFRLALSGIFDKLIHVDRIRVDFCGFLILD